VTNVSLVNRALKKKCVKCKSKSVQSYERMSVDVFCPTSWFGHNSQDSGTDFHCDVIL